MTPTLAKKPPDIGARFAAAIVRARWIVIALSLAIVVTLGFGARDIRILTDYREFFSPENPELRSFQEFEATYTKADNLFFLVKPADGNVFSRETLTAIEDLTRLSWQVPFASRVDSLTNFQHTYAIGDELIVRDLIEDAASLTEAEISARKAIALEEPLVRGLIVSPQADAAAINVRINMPGRSVAELPAIMAAAKKLRADVMAQFPAVEIRISGMVALNNAFTEDGPIAFATLAPIMLLLIIALATFFLRSVAATGAILLLITLATVAAMGIAGTLGIGISPVSAAAPIIILTLSVADSVHILTSIRHGLAESLDRRNAIIEAVRTNLLPVTVTSATTIIGFLALNSSDAPPLRALGNISAIGVAMAWALSLTLLPALASFIRTKPGATTRGTRLMASLGAFVARRHRVLLLIMAGISAAMIALVPRLEVNDKFAEYFDERVEIRRDFDAITPHFGPVNIEFSIPAAGPGGVSDPTYLEVLGRFADFLREQPNVTHVYALTDIIKRLNRNMHGDDRAFHAIPENRDLAAQYLLLYELSLPYGLDLNDRINVDKSASRVSVSLRPPTTQETKALLAGVEAWFAENAPEIKPTYTGAQIMFTRITDRNLRSMIVGGALGALGISLIMMLALRSIGLGFLSMLPNIIPILSAFGAWALINGEVGFSIAAVASISLGIVVDDTVHMLTTYMRARRAQGMDPQAAIQHTFKTVGAAIFTTTVILTAGFLVLAFATFKPTVDMGVLTALAFAFASLFDIFVLPGLLLLTARRNRHSESLAERTIT